MFFILARACLGPFLEVFWPSLDANNAPIEMNANFEATSHEASWMKLSCGLLHIGLDEAQLYIIEGLASHLKPNSAARSTCALTKAWLRLRLTFRDEHPLMSEPCAVQPFISEICLAHALIAACGGCSSCHLCCSNMLVQKRSWLASLIVIMRICMSPEPCQVEGWVLVSRFLILAGHQLALSSSCCSCLGSSHDPAQLFNLDKVFVPIYAVQGVWLHGGLELSKPPSSAARSLQRPTQPLGTHQHQVLRSKSTKGLGQAFLSRLPCPPTPLLMGSLMVVLALGHFWRFLQAMA